MLPPKEQQQPLTNAELAERLDEVAGLLEAQQANPYRVRAYRTAAQTLRALQRPVHELISSRGSEALTELPGIGVSLARTIERLVHTGGFGLLERLRGDFAPERVLATVPGLGRELAARIHRELGIESLADLELAAYDGRLQKVAGVGAKRIRGIRESLAGRFRRGPLQPESLRRRVTSMDPPVAELLDIDREYRRKAAAGQLPTIAPRRFNPTHVSWLPILHTHRGDRHYTALYSNTARAHELGTTRDWVVIYRDDQVGDGQWTVITALMGKLRGQRIVRGREQECAELVEEPQSRQLGLFDTP